MQHGVGAASQSHIHGQSITKRFLGHNIPRTDISAKKLHHLHTGLLGQLDALGIYRGNSAVAPQPHTQHLGKAVHGVRCIHTGA